MDIVSDLMVSEIGERHQTDAACVPYSTWYYVQDLAKISMSIVLRDQANQEVHFADQRDPEWSVFHAVESLSLLDVTTIFAVCAAGKYNVESADWGLAQIICSRVEVKEKRAQIAQRVLEGDFHENFLKGLRTHVCPEDVPEWVSGQWRPGIEAWLRKESVIPDDGLFSMAEALVSLSGSGKAYFDLYFQYSLSGLGKVVSCPSFEMESSLAAIRHAFRLEYPVGDNPENDLAGFSIPMTMSFYRMLYDEYSPMQEFTQRSKFGAAII